MTITAVASKTHLLLRDRGARRWGEMQFFFMGKKLFFFAIFLPFFCCVQFFTFEIGGGRLETLFQKLYLSTPPHPVHGARRGEGKGRASGLMRSLLPREAGGGGVGCARRNRFTLFIHEVQYGAQVQTELQMRTIRRCVMANLWRALNVQLGGIKGAL